MSLADAVASDCRLEGLKALRGRLAEDLDGCESCRDVASLSQRLMDVMAQIDEVGGGVVLVKEETPLDRFTQRRIERESAPKAPRRAKSS